MVKDVSDFISVPPEVIRISYEIAVKVNEIYDKDVEYFYRPCKAALFTSRPVSAMTHGLVKNASFPSRNTIRQILRLH
jgi:hypothetical protein